MKKVYYIIATLLLLLSSFSAFAGGKVLCLHHNDLHIDVANHQPHSGHGDSCSDHSHGEDHEDAHSHINEWSEINSACVDIPLQGEEMCLRALQGLKTYDLYFAQPLLSDFTVFAEAMPANALYRAALPARAPPEIIPNEKRNHFLSHIRLLN